MAAVRKVLRFEVPPETPAKSCLSCGRRIFWIVTTGGKKMPVDPTGESHFATCPQAAKFRGKTRAELAQTDLFGKDKP